MMSAVLQKNNKDSTKHRAQPRLAQRPLLLDLTSALVVSLLTLPSCRVVKEASGKIHGLRAACAAALSANRLFVHGHGMDVALLGQQPCWRNRQQADTSDAYVGR